MINSTLRKQKERPFASMDEYRDDELCAECGGKCCYVYGPPYNMNAKKLHEDKKQIYGGGNREEYGVEPLPKKIHPHA